MGTFVTAVAVPMVAEGISLAGGGVALQEARATFLAGATNRIASPIF